MHEDILPGRHFLLTGPMYMPVILDFFDPNPCKLKSALVILTCTNNRLHT